MNCEGKQAAGNDRPGRGETGEEIYSERIHAAEIRMVLSEEEKMHL